MTMMKPHFSFALRWGDESAIRNFRSTPTKSKEVIKLSIENQLKDMAQRFERSPNVTTISFWAIDLVEAGCDDQILKQVLKSVPFKFERCPTLAQLMELIRPHLALKSFSESDLDRYTGIIKNHAKARFRTLLGDEAVAKMISYYRKEVCTDFAAFHEEHILLCVVFDWIRCYCSNQPQKIVEQGKISNQKYLEGDQEYFVAPLRRYAQENNLHFKPE